MRKTVYISEGSSGKWLLPLLLIEFAGIAAGSFISMYIRESAVFRRYICPELFGGSLLEIFTGTLVTLLIFLMAAFFFGLCVFGQPFGAALLICLGAECACSAALIYAEMGMSGLLSVIILNLPKTAVVSLVGILAVRELMRNSCGLLRSTINGADSPDFRKYCMRYAVLAAVVLIISAADVLVNHFFGIKIP